MNIKCELSLSNIHYMKKIYNEYFKKKTLLDCNLTYDVNSRMTFKFKI